MPVAIPSDVASQCTAVAQPEEPIVWAKGIIVRVWRQMKQQRRRPVRALIRDATQVRFECGVCIIILFFQAFGVECIAYCYGVICIHICIHTSIVLYAIDHLKHTSHPTILLELLF